MTLVQLRAVQDVIDEALDSLKGASNQEIVAWIRKHYPDVIAQHQDELADSGLLVRIRERRKQRSPIEEMKSSRQLCLDFDLPELQLDSEISIPKDLDDLLYGQVDWKEADDATLAEIDAHILLLEAQAAASIAKADNWRRVRQAAAKYAKGNLGLTLRQLREIARKNRK